jgi:hypothetical protein
VSYLVRPHDDAVEKGTFHCGQQDLDVYLRRYASQDMRRGVARVLVATPRDEPRRPAGLFLLSTGNVSAEDLPLESACKLPRYPVPVALLGRLAVDETFTGRGPGSIMLSDACKKVIQASRVLAVAALLVAMPRIRRRRHSIGTSALRSFRADPTDSCCRRGYCGNSFPGRTSLTRADGFG